MDLIILGSYDDCYIYNIDKVEAAQLPANIFKLPIQYHSISTAGQRDHSIFHMQHIPTCVFFNCQG